MNAGYAEILTKDEVRALTGRSHRGDQTAWLLENHWKFALNAANDPIVGRWYTRIKLAGVDAADAAASTAGPLPDWSKLS
jgi:hypothetical protein